MANEPVIQVIGLRAEYGHEVVLEGVSFEVGRREIFGILGGSGSGKSTILRHLIGLRQPAAGSVRLFGQDTQAVGEDGWRALRQRFGILYQSGALFGAMTVGENVALPLQEYTDLPPDAVAAVVRHKLHLVDLDGCAGLYPAQLSGGMRKRAGLARAMSLDPELLFFDEPSSGLDPVLAADLDRLILRLRDTLGTTMVLVTHDLDSTLAVADRVILVDRRAKGIVAVGRPGDLMDSADVRVRAFFSRGGLRGTVADRGGAAERTT